MSTPIAAGLFTWPAAEPQLIGSRRAATGTIVFPAELGEEQILLSGEGTLFSYTTQEFPPPSPYVGPTGAGEFVRYGVAMVQLPEGVLVEGIVRLGGDAAEPRIGQRMRMIVIDFPTTDHRDVVTYAFEPIGG